MRDQLGAQMVHRMFALRPLGLERVLEQLLQSLVVFLDQVQCVHGRPQLQPLCLDLGPALGQLITGGQMIQREVGLPEGFLEKRGVE